jgi:hypothetical protein
MKEDTWEKESREWQQASADDIIKNMDDTKNIAEKLLNSFNLDGKITELHAEEIKSLILAELQALKEEAKGESKQEIETAGPLDYQDGFAAGWNAHRQHTIEAFEKRGVK